MKLRYLVLFLGLLSALILQAQDGYNPVPHPEAVVVSGNMRFTVLTSRMIRMQYSSTAKFEDRASFAVVNRNLPVPEFTTQTEDAYLTITTSDLELRYRIGSQPKASDHSTKNLSITFSLNGQSVVWYPGKDDALNLGGTRRTLDNAWGDSFKVGIEKGLLSRAGWSIIDESPSAQRGDGSRSFVFQPTSDGFYWFDQPVDPSATDWYFLGYGHDYKQCLRDFVLIAGRIPLPPKYIFGYWYSRYYAYTQQQFRQLVMEIERYNIPIDVMIVDTDWHINGWTGWSWNTNLIPNPKQLISYFHQHGLKTSLNLHPAFGVESNEDNYPLLRADMGLPSTSTETIPWQLNDYKFYKSMFNNIIRLREKEGVDFWWLDWQQWLTNPYVDGLGETFWCNHVFFEDMRLNRPEVRPVIFHRWGGLGSHRYQIGFSGDTFSAWSTLAFEVGFTSQASNVGYTYWGHDLGGHQGGNNDPELFLRWMQFGAFTPIFRSHATNASNLERRIWRYSNFPQLLDAVRLRYRIFPYLYTAARETFETGIGMNRPLYYEYPEENNAYKYEDEYFFGNDMLVAPVYTPIQSDGYAHRSIWLPEGKWWDTSSCRLISGNRTFVGYFTTDEIPLYYRAGSIIPNYPDQRTVQTTPDTIIVQVVPGADGEGRFYEDAGDTQDYPTQFADTRFSQRRAGEDVDFQIAAREGHFEGMPAERVWQVEFLGQEALPEGVTLDGQDVLSDSQVCHYDADSRMLVITVPRRSCSSPVNIRILGAPKTMAHL